MNKRLCLDATRLAESLEHRGRHESEGRWSIAVDAENELPLILKALALYGLVRVIADSGVMTTNEK